MHRLEGSSVICFSDLKQAALYFDRVIPGSLEAIGSIDNGEFGLVSPEEVSAEVVQRLVSGILSNNEAPIAFGDFVFLWQEHLLGRLPLFSNEGATKKIQDLYIADAASPSGRTRIRAVFREFYRALGCDSATVMLSSSALNGEGATDEDLTLSLVQANLVDTENITWDEVFAIRNDPVLRKKLRNLRLFVNEAYRGKSRGYVEDDLNKRLEDYVDVCKEFHFETKTSVLSVLLDAKNLHAAVGGGLVTALLGGGLAGISVAACIELGAVSIEIAKRRHAFNKLRNDHELGYIVGVKDNVK